MYSRKINCKIHICLDPKDLNLAIKRRHYATRTLDEVTHHLGSARVFSKLNARSGYWSVHLDQPSSLLTTFYSAFGRYRFLCLPFGLNLSQDVFQERMDRILEYCPGKIGIADDVGVFGKVEGIVKTCDLARSHVYWPVISKDITDMIQTCLKCRDHTNQQCNEPLLQYDTPTRQWQDLNSDLLYYNNITYLLICDYYINSHLYTLCARP